MQLLIELPKELEEHFAMDKFKDSFMRICGDIKEVVRSHSKPGPSLGLSGRYEEELVDALAKAFEAAVDIENLDHIELREPTPEEIEKGKIWRVTMNAWAHHDKWERGEMNTVMFVDALDMYDAEQIAYRKFERQAKENGWEEIGIWRTVVKPAK